MRKRAQAEQPVRCGEPPVVREGHTDYSSRCSKAALAAMLEGRAEEAYCGTPAAGPAVNRSIDVYALIVWSGYRVSGGANRGWAVRVHSGSALPVSHAAEFSEGG